MRRFLFVSLLLACGGCAAPSGLPESEAPCGITTCGIEPDDDVPDYTEPADQGKFDREGVEEALRAHVMDGVLDAAEVEDLFDAAGARVGRGEMRVIREGVTSRDYEVTDEATATALRMAAIANLFPYEAEHLSSVGRSYGGSEIPHAVRTYVARARLHGAVAYDVREVDEDDGELVWNPYPSTTPSVENMAFAYTEITPTALEIDLADRTTVFRRIAGTETAEHCDAGGNCQEYRQVTYVDQLGGTGDVLASYDEVYHPDVYARGSQGQRWANNCAILSDGSFHCLPAARRSVVRDLILTNPHLSRCNAYPGYEEDCRHLLYHGHIDIRAGVVVGVEMSGRISKRAARDQATFIDPIGLLEAWGFTVAPDVRLRFGNVRSGVPVRDAEAGVIRAAAPRP